MILTLVANEWRALLRDGRAVTILTLGAILAVVASWAAASTDHRERLGHGDATEAARGAWLEREADNPHSRAHYGDFVFRPSGPLAGLDSGLQMVTGRSVRLEAHRQNDSVHVPSREASSLLRFDRLEPSTVLNLLVPLLLVLAGFGSVASERESGRLRLLRTQGVRPMTLLLGKSLSLWSIGLALVLLVIGSHLLFMHEQPAAGPTALFLALHAAQLWIVATLIACVSSLTRRSGGAAALLMGLWVASAILLPRLAAVAADTLFPLPSRDGFDAAMREDREMGLDGHNPQDARRLEIEQGVLDEYGVDSREELPINISGVLMQADEDYGNQVWDKHFGELRDLLLRQSALVGAISVLNPLQATDRISMAIAGTDLGSHLDFLQQAERHRRDLVKALNDEDAFGGAKTGERGWKASPEFYASFEPFAFEPRSLRDAMAQQTTEFAGLALWFVGLLGLLLLSARRLERGGSL